MGVGMMTNEEEEDGLMGHPYGVLPNGNELLLLSSSCKNDNMRRRPQEACVYFEGGDSIWLNCILVFCDGISLGRVVQTCRYLYVIGHSPSLWRDVTLSSSSSASAVLTNCHGGWKDTYTRLHHPLKEFQPHVPMRIANMYSDTLFHYHSCANFSIPSHWYTTNTNTSTSSSSSSSDNAVPFVDYSNNDNVDALKVYECENRPVVLTNVCVWTRDIVPQWTTHLTNYDEYATVPLRSTSGAASHSAQFTLAGYETYCCNNDNIHREEAPLYLFDREALMGKCPQLSQDYQSRQSAIRQPFEHASHKYDLFEGLGHNQRPDHTWFIAGPKRSGSLFHVDPNATHAWNVCITGQKRWIFYAPHLTPPGVHPSSNGETVTMPLSLGEWIVQYYPQHCRLKKRHPHHILECTVGPGDLVFVPHGWWHAVINIADGMNMAVTHNYVSTTNLPTVLRFLRTKQQLISGCRDRPHQAIPPSQLYQACTTLWKQQLPPSIYNNALTQSQNGWTNAAWTDDNDNDDTSPTQQQQHPTNKKKIPNNNNNKTMLLKRKQQQQQPSSSNTTTSKKKYNTSSIIALAKSSCSSTTTSSITQQQEEKKEDSSLFQFSFL